MPTSQLFDRIFSKTDSAGLLFLEHRCLRSRLNRNRCRACLDECLPGALTLDGRRIVFNGEKCTYCMRCVSVCPNDACDGGLDPMRLLETLGSLSEVVLTCRKNNHVQQEYVIPCIGFLTESLLAAMNSVALDSLSVDLSSCPGCINEDCLGPFYEKMANLYDKLKVAGRISLKYNRDYNSAHPVDENLDRRSYFGWAKKTLIDCGQELVGLGYPETSTSHKSTDKGPAMDSVALYYAYKTSSEDNKSILLSYLYTVRATQQCNLCPGCQGMCPTGALKRRVVEGEKRLMFTSSACSGCGLCQEFCKKDALELILGFSGDPGEPLRIR
jgi:ferredoxin